MFRSVKPGWGIGMGTLREASAIVPPDSSKSTAFVMVHRSSPRYHRRGPEHYLYLLSRLLTCGKCGQRLQGKSAYSSNRKSHRYYSHRSKCPEGGLDRIDAEMAQELVLGWLRDVASNGERFRELEAQGRERIGRQIGELREESVKLEAELTGIKRQIDARIQELTRAKAERVRESIEKRLFRNSDGRESGVPEAFGHQV
jgi:hypothetical protein